MATQLNTFAAVLLAFPFYIAQRGRLKTYIDFAKPSATTAPPASSQANAGNSSSAPAKSDSSATSGASQPSMDASQAVALSSVFSDAMKLFV